MTFPFVSFFLLTFSVTTVTSIYSVQLDTQKKRHAGCSSLKSAGKSVVSDFAGCRGSGPPVPTSVVTLREEEGGGEPVRRNTHCHRSSDGSRSNLWRKIGVWPCIELCIEHQRSLSQIIRLGVL